MTTDREAASALLADASNRVIRTVDGLDGDDWSAPSLLPGWTRAHVVAHLALNAEAMSRALHGFEHDGLIDMEGRRVKILDVKGLRGRA